MCKCVFVLICKYTNAQVCVCVYVLMHVCLCVLMNLYAYMLMYVTMHVLMCEYVNLSICQCSIVFVRQYISVFNKVIQGTSSLQILPPFRPKTLRNHGIFQDFKTPLPATVLSEC